MDSLDVDKQLWKLSMQAASSGLFARAKEIIPLIKQPGIRTKAINTLDMLEGAEKIEDYTLLSLHGDSRAWDDFKKAHPSAYKSFTKTVADYMAKLEEQRKKDAKKKKPKKKPDPPS